MLYRIKIKSRESEDFLREIKIDADATFLELCQAILESCGFADDQMTSFWLLDGGRTRRCQITREDMGVGPEDEDVYVMADTRLEEVIEEEGTRMEFVFDTFADRCFSLTVQEEIPGEHLDAPVVSRKKGRAPEQLRMPSVEAPRTPSAAGGLDEEEFDDPFAFSSDQFNADELDLEGYEISE